jgi:hypothetical protein
VCFVSLFMRNVKTHGRVKLILNGQLLMSNYLYGDVYNMKREVREQIKLRNVESKTNASRLGSSFL